MGKLEISFLGICMHLQQCDDVKLPRGVKHRVVLVDASKDRKTVHFGDLPAHHSVLVYSPGELVESSLTSLEGFIPFGSGFLLKLDGWRLTVPNARDAFSADLGDVPRLTEFDPQMKLRDDLVEEGPPRYAACFVDISHGHVRTDEFQVEDPGIYSSWSVETDGQPELELEGRNGDVLRMVLPMHSAGDGHFPFGIPGTLVLANVTMNARDKENDFVLHYLAAQGGIPPAFARRPPHAAAPALPHHMFGLTGSCSNSQYP